MNMAEAKAKLMELADGGYHSLDYSINDHGNGRVSQTCKVYLPEHGHFESGHWETSLAMLQEAMAGKPPISEDLPLSTKTLAAVA